jgi:hypothetical protein
MQIIGFGFVLCFDSFLYTFTILPIRFALAFSRLLINAVTRSSKPLPPSQKADLLRMLLLVLSVALLIPMTDARLTCIISTVNFGLTPITVKYIILSVAKIQSSCMLYSMLSK